MKSKGKKTKSLSVEWKPAPDIKERLLHLKKSLNLDWIEESHIYCFRSTNSKSRSYARIWGLPKLWQKALNVKPSYIIEVLSENFDKKNPYEKDRILLHELTHIPKNFSGSLLPHIKRAGRRNFERRVRELFLTYLKKK